MNKDKTWLKFRHKVITALLRPFLGTYVRWKYHIKIEKYRDPARRPHLILMNHQTAFDQFFVGLSFPGPVYYLASEDLFSMGWVSRLIEWLVAPIPIKKQTTDLQAVKNCIRVAKEGGTVCIAPEGQRTFHGRTVYMSPAIAGLARKMGMPIAIYRIDGGYGIQPRWSDVVRGGKMRGYVSRVIEPEEYAAMNNTELSELIRQELTVDEARVTGQFPHRKNAEFLERVMYVCPWCGLSEFESHGDIIHCKKCGRKIRHLSTKQLQGVDCEFPYEFVSQWYDAQEAFLNETDTLALTAEPVWQETAQLSLVHPYKNKEVLCKEVAVSLYGDRLVIGDREFPFEKVSAITILGKNKLNVYWEREILQLKGGKRFNGLKYLNFYHRFKNLTTGDRNGKYLGL